MQTNLPYHLGKLCLPVFIVLKSKVYSNNWGGCSLIYGGQGYILGPPLIVDQLFLLLGKVRHSALSVKNCSFTKCKKITIKTGCLNTSTKVWLLANI